MKSSFIIYMIESGIGLGIFYIIFSLFLRKETFFGMNRLFLISSLFLSLIIPCLDISISLNDKLSDVIIAVPELSVTNNLSEEIKIVETHSYLELGLLVYALISLGLLLRFIYSLYKIFQLKGIGKIERYKNVNYVYHNLNVGSFSFLDNCFIPETLKGEQEALTAIINHENAHIYNLHSIDIIFLEIICSILWINPLVWIFRKRLKEIHEFQADRCSIKNISSKIRYQNILVGQISESCLFNFTNNFKLNNSLIKKRIQMMSRKQSSKINSTKYFLIVPVAILVFFISSKTEAVSSTISVKKASDFIENVKSVKEEILETPLQKSSDDTTIYVVIKTAPEFRNGLSSLKKYLNKNLEYPAEAKNKGIEGRVHLNFIVEKDGSVSNVKVLKSPSPLLSKSAIDVVKNMPKWKPGLDDDNKPVRTALVFPVQFSLNKSDKKK
ncbi:MAG: TonB family protein [Hyphomicrobiales bacterium]